MEKRKQQVQKTYQKWEKVKEGEWRHTSFMYIVLEVISSHAVKCMGVEVSESRCGEKDDFSEELHGEYKEGQRSSLTIYLLCLDRREGREKVKHQ